MLYNVSACDVSLCLYTAGFLIFTPSCSTYSFAYFLHWLQENTRPSSLQSSSIAITDGTNCDIVSLAQTLKLVVPSSVRECRRKNEAISNRARHDVIKSSLVILQATIGRDAPSQSEFEVCAQRIVALLPELKDPIPPIRQDAFKPWVCAWLSVQTCSILFGILIV